MTRLVPLTPSLLWKRQGHSKGTMLKEIEHKANERECGVFTDSGPQSDTIKKGAGNPADKRSRTAVATDTNVRPPAMQLPWRNTKTDGGGWIGHGLDATLGDPSP